MAQVDGYYTLACFFNLPANVPILRHFGNLNILNLLYIQAELVRLESKLYNIASEDANSGNSIRKEFTYSMIRL